METIELLNLITNGFIFAGLLYALYIQRDQIKNLREERDMLQLWIFDNTELDRQGVEEISAPK